jgi:hypothetical protein
MNVCESEGARLVDTLPLIPGWSQNAEAPVLCPRNNFDIPSTIFRLREFGKNVIFAEFSPASRFKARELKKRALVSC